MINSKTEQELIERFGGIALHKQLDFADIIGNNDWQVDMTEGTISFGQDLCFPLQVLGTISHLSQTWLWAWANTKSRLTDNVLEQSLLLRKYGDENEIDLLRNESFDFSKDQLHLIGLIASGMFNASAYYIADYGQGAMLLTIKTGKVNENISDKHFRILSVIPQLISQFDINHKNAVRYYLMEKGYSITEAGDSIIGSKDGKTVSVTFDHFSRLTNITG